MPGKFLLDRHLINYIQFFLAGLLMADVYVEEWGGSPPPLRRGTLAWGDSAWLIGVPAAVWVLARGGQVSHIAFPILILALCVATFQSVWMRRLLRIEILTVIGGMCYSIYLFHNSVIQVFAPFAMRGTPQNYVAAILVLALCIVPLILAFCGLYFRLIEKPCMRPDWPRRMRDWFMTHLFVDESGDKQNGVGNPSQFDR
jgi:peptidoglycan/LPS O-acetylase OafA/YrhL